MEEGFVRGLVTFLGVLLFIVIPLIRRIRSTTRSGRATEGREAGGRQAGRKVAEDELAEEVQQEQRLPGPPAVGATVPAARQAAAAPSPTAPRAPLPAARPAPLPIAEAVPPVRQEPALPLLRPRQLTPWQRAVLWAEILGPPRGLDGGPESGG